MATIKTRIRLAPDGTLSARVDGVRPGEHEAKIVLHDTQRGGARPDIATLLARVRAIREEIARLPVLDSRTADEIIGYNICGNFD